MVAAVYYGNWGLGMRVLALGEELLRKAQCFSPQRAELFPPWAPALHIFMTLCVCVCVFITIEVSLKECWFKVGIY